VETESQPDLIYAHYIPTGYFVGSVTHAPIVVSAYGWDLSMLPRKRMWASAIVRMANRIDRLIVEGPHMRDTAISLGLRPEQVAIVRISAGLEDVAFRSPRTDPDSAPRFICPGRMVEKKGHAYAVQAFAKLAPKLPSGSRLVLVGDGRLEPMLRQLTADLGIADRVDFPGAMTRQQYLQLQAGADVMLAPSTTGSTGDSEGGAPTTILDAQATGTITIGSRHADIPFLIEDGVTGFLFDERDVDGLVATIQRALDLRSNWPVMAASARKRVVELHSDSAVAASLRQLYLEVLNQDRGRLPDTRAI
jgi:colanic acid/amylovoran biosynthesis glycosyltransferase